MRFLFIYHDYADKARELLENLGVRDVTLIVLRKNADCPDDAELDLLRKHQGAEAAACEVNRKYRKCASAYVNFCCEPKKFRFEDQQLREWLVPKEWVAPSLHSPSDAFRGAASRTSYLVLHPDALKMADEIAEHRWSFTADAADLLARCALGEPLGALRDWKRNYGVEFAPNGQVSFRYEGTCGTEVRRNRTEWHLKEGDNTSRESAARIYFERVDFESGLRVVVFYVGPHPPDGERQVRFHAI